MGRPFCKPAFNPPFFVPLRYSIMNLFICVNASIYIYVNKLLFNLHPFTYTVLFIPPIHQMFPVHSACQMAAGLQTPNAKTHRFCTRNPYTEVIRVSVFGASPIGYQCLVHGSPTWSPPESNLCIRNFCPVLIYIYIYKPWTQMGLHILQDLPHKMLLVNPPKKEVNWVLGMYSFFCYASMGWIFRGWSQNPTKASLWCAESSCLTL